MLLIFDLDDTLIHTHRVFLALTEEFLRRMAALGLADENVYYTLDAFDRENIESAEAYVPWAFPRAMRQTYEFYCEKYFAPYDEAVAEELEALGESFRYAEYPLIDGAKQLLDEVLEAGHTTVLLTQGAYDEQRFKVEQQNLAEFFAEIIVVDKKNAAGAGQYYAAARLCARRYHRYRQQPQKRYCPGAGFRRISDKSGGDGQLGF